MVKKFHPEVLAEKDGAKHLSQHFLNVKMENKNDWRFHLHWERENLKDDQIIYAANDVLTVMAVLLKGKI